MRIRSTAALLLSAIALAGCKGLKDALTAHTDVAAEAANTELSATRLGTMLGTAKIGIEPNADNARVVAELWADYQRIGFAAAHNDSLTAYTDAALGPILDNMRVSMMIDTLRSKIQLPKDPEAAYNAGAGGILAARHILFKYPDPNIPNQPISQAAKDSVRKIAMAVKPQVTDANFAAMAKKYSGDPGSKDNGGAYPPFKYGDMVKEFSAGVAAVKPGEINPNLIETSYGIHLIERLPYSAVKQQYDAQFQEVSGMIADSIISSQLMTGGEIAVKPSAPAQIKEALRQPGNHKKDKTVVATFKGGEMTMANLLGWIDVMPGQNRAQVIQVLPTLQDSQVTAFTKNLAMRQVLLHRADSAKIDVPAADKEQLKAQFLTLVQQTWMGLGLSPKELADSAKTEKDREHLAAAKVDTLMSRILAGEAQPVGIQMPVRAALDVKYKADLNASGIERAVEIGKKAKASADSARALQPSALPQFGGAPGSAQQAPPAQTPPPANKKKP